MIHSPLFDCRNKGPIVGSLTKHVAFLVRVLIHLLQLLRHLNPLKIYIDGDKIVEKQPYRKLKTILCIIEINKYQNIETSQSLHHILAPSVSDQLHDRRAQQ